MHRSRTTMIQSELAHGEMPPLHVHAEDESFHVFEGSLTVYHGEGSVRLEAGDTLVAPRGGPSHLPGRIGQDSPAHDLAR